MPSKYVLRDFSQNSYYHVLNGGTGTKEIFLEDVDYTFFKVYLFTYLRPVNEVLAKYPDLPRRLHNKNLSEEVELLAYSLSPNHFHMLLRQKTIDGVSKLMKQMANAYTYYYNRKNNSSGSVMQGRFKAIKVEGFLTQIVRYIHLEPIIARPGRNIDSYKWSSYLEYLGKEKDAFCTKSEILSKFSSLGDFENFHKDMEGYKKEPESINKLTIDG